MLHATLASRSVACHLLCVVLPAILPFCVLEDVSIWHWRYVPGANTGGQRRDLACLCLSMRKILCPKHRTGVSEVAARHLCNLVCAFVVRGVPNSKQPWKPGLAIQGIPDRRSWHLFS